MNKILILSTIFLAGFALLFLGANPGIASASTTGTIKINVDSNGGADPDCWPADNSCSTWWGDGADRGVDLNSCAKKAVKYATGLSNISDLDITYQATTKIIACNGFDRGNTSYQTYEISYSPKTPQTPLTVSCYASPNSINVGQSTVFTSSALGGNGSYSYSWSGACSGAGLTCSNTLNSQGTQTATVTVTSGLLTATASCSVYVGQNCTQSYEQRCSGNNLYWYDSCGQRGAFIQACANGCYNNSCQGGNCTQNYEQRCLGNNLYWYNSCGQQGSYIQTCSNGCYNNSCQNNTCSYHATQRCVGNNLYWYDSCGLQQDYIGNCNNYNNYNYSYGNCTYHAYKLCQGNNIYWYDSCGTQQDLYYTCGSGQTCQYGQCASYIQPVNNYVAHNNIKCYGSSLYWYDSLGSVNTIYKNCSDSNTCTLESCSGSKCSNILKCDGTTCAKDSTDFTKFCPSKPVVTDKCGNETCETTDGETAENCPSDCKSDSAGLIVSFFNRESVDEQWQKTSAVSSNGQIYFMISVQNTSASQINDATVSANIPTEVSSLGNVQIDGVTVIGDIVSGISIGQLPLSGTKTITFEGKTQMLATDEIKQATASVAVSGITKSDSVSIDFNLEQATASISGAPNTTGLLGFLKRWYLWIIGGIVLVFLFVIVFRRLSTES